MSPAEADSGAGFPPVLTTADAAELLHVHVEYLRKLVRDGKVPCHRFPGGREMRFDRDELLEWLRSQPGHDQSTSTKIESPASIRIVTAIDATTPRPIFSASSAKRPMRPRVSRA